MTLFAPPVTAPVAVLLLNVSVSPVAPTSPPPKLSVPTVTLPLALELEMLPVQPGQPLPLLPVSPPALLWLPAVTLPTADELLMLEPLSPTRPPAERNAPLPPIAPLACEPPIVPPADMPTRPPRLLGA